MGEEIANTVTHGVMSLVALVALPFAAVWAYVHDPNRVTASVSVSIFVISIFLMFLASTLYHSMNPASKHKAVFHILDHIFIYVAIAGSYTPDRLVGHRRLAGDIHYHPAVGDGAVRHLLQVAVAQLDPGHQPDDLSGDGWTIVFFLPLSCGRPRRRCWC